MATIALFLPFDVLSARNNNPPELTGFSVRLKPDDNFPRVAPGATGAVFFELSNRSNKDLTIKWQITSNPGSQNAETRRETLKIGAGKTVVFPVDDAVASRRGVVTFDWVAEDQDGRRLALTDRLAVMTLPVKETPQFLRWVKPGA